jgi:hypothetical protein
VEQVEERIAGDSQRLAGKDYKQAEAVVEVVVRVVVQGDTAAAGVANGCFEIHNHNLRIKHFVQAEDVELEEHSIEDYIVLQLEVVHVFAELQLRLPTKQHTRDVLAEEEEGDQEEEVVAAL